MLLKDALALDFNKEIEAVIKVGNFSEQGASEEINNYIVTDEISKSINDFIKAYKEKTKETGVWISGFYGSGKSYLAKILGYLLENPALLGVEARELFKSRLAGLDGSFLLENVIASLSNYKTKVVTFDLSGEASTNTFYKMLLLNFLKSIGLTKDYIGYNEFQIMKTDRYEDFLQEANALSGEGWEKARNNRMQAPGIIKKAWSKIFGDEEKETEDILNRSHQLIDSFDADSLTKELDAFLEMSNEYDRIVFIVDEVSEAIDKDNLAISELRGTAQHLSKNGEGKYWFVATAQEKLDNILSQKNISQNDINTITDRFQLKLHLSSAQVDKVIKERILAKTEEGARHLNDFYQDKKGLINELATLNGKFDTNIHAAEEFVDTYPFLPYQMRLLKNFLFKVFQQAQAGGSERGMLITVDRILKNEDFSNKEAGNFVTAYQLCEYGFPMLQSEMEEKFNKASKDLAEEDKALDGKSLMRTLFFLENSYDLKRTVDNIVKTYLHEAQYVGDIKPSFETALQFLEEKNYVLGENYEYKITSDTEEKLMQEMNLLTSTWEERMELVRELIKKLPLISKASTISLEGKTYNVALRDDQGTLLSSKDGEVKILCYNLLNVDDDYDAAVESLKEQHIDLDEAALVPSVKHKDEIDRVARKVYKYEKIISRYRNSTDDEIKKVVKSFQTIHDDQRRNLQQMISESYQNSVLIYDFSEEKLDKSSVDLKINTIEQKMIDRTFAKRLKSHLSDVSRSFLTAPNKRLAEHCNNSQFAFFDSDGSFIGDQLRVVSEINKECQEKSGRMGSNLLDVFTSKPYGWEVEDITGTLAALMRAGKLKIQYEGNVLRDYKSEKVLKIFDSINRLKKAKFFTIIETEPDPATKQKVVECLLNLDQKGFLSVSYNSNGFEVVQDIYSVMDQYYSIYKKNVTKLEQGIVEEGRQDIDTLKQFSQKKALDGDLQEQAREFLNNRETIKSGVGYCIELKHFLEHKYQKYLEQSRFANHVKQDLPNIDLEEQKESLTVLLEQFETLVNQGVIDHVDQIKDKYNEIRQQFFAIFKEYFRLYQDTCKDLLEVSIEKNREIEEVSVPANKEMHDNIKHYMKNCPLYIRTEFSLGKSEPKESSTNSTLKEIRMGTELNQNRIVEVKRYTVIKPPKPNGNGPKIYSLTLPKESNNVDYIKKKLNSVLSDLEDKKYDTVQIKIE